MRYVCSLSFMLNHSLGQAMEVEMSFKNILKIRWTLVLYDIIILAFSEVLLLAVYRGTENLGYTDILTHSVLAAACVLIGRFICNVYRQIWRYGGVQCYIRLLFSDALAFLLYLTFVYVLPIGKVSFARMLALVCVNLLGALTIRLFYRYAYKCSNDETSWGKCLAVLLKIFSGVENANNGRANRIKIALIGAGNVGVGLAEELMSNPSSAYSPRCFIDTSKQKIGREIHGLPVLSVEEAVASRLSEFEVQEVVFTIPSLDNEKKKRLYEYYKQAGYKIKVYDYPAIQAVGGKRQLRDFDVEELLFRRPLLVTDKKTVQYYTGKVVLITGGGGSIGSELCRQLAKMQPKQLIILDIYENGAYDIQQELKIAFGNSLDIRIEIASITNKSAIERIFELYRPQIVINAAAHKHVPLMEHNCIEAIENNVFGTKNVVDMCEKYGAESFIMVSTDKAVNPTNVMGATKRMCEMIVQSAGLYGNVKYSATRFGNVLGSAGSVIPLFKRQIANGGPITLTDKRIIRYFMTIPEASQLVLQSGAMANNGELFVLDMGKPVKILDLAENMIKLSGATEIEIVEIGLRPGEKLYEELLVDTETLDKTENSLIFIEKDRPLSRDQIQEKLALLKSACETGDEETAKEALFDVIPTYRPAEEVNENFDDKKVQVSRLDFHDTRKHMHGTERLAAR